MFYILDVLGLFMLNSLAARGSHELAPHRLNLN
jgi:hypothetical protein